LQTAKKGPPARALSVCRVFLKLLECASATVRTKLEASNPQAVAAVRDTIDDVATAMQRDVR
jgi:hypothetical protein